MGWGERYISRAVKVMKYSKGEKGRGKGIESEGGKKRGGRVRIEERGKSEEKRK